MYDFKSHTDGKFTFAAAATKKHSYDTVFFYENMAKQQKLSAPAMHRAALYAQMPSWFDRDSTFTTSPDRVHLAFVKPCVCGERKQSVYVGKAQGPELAAKLAAAVDRKHKTCHGQTTTAAAPPESALALSQLQATIHDLERQLKRQKRKADDFEAQNAALVSKVSKGCAARSAMSTAKRLKTAAINKRQPIDSANQTEFGVGMKGHVMVGPKSDRDERSQPTFIVDTLEYHCQGSERKLLDVVLDIVRRYSLEDAVLGQLGAATESTAAYIVGRARASLQELKKCQSEGQRQQYRTVLTALAPEDGAGMAAPVAAALGVGRQKRPFLDALAKRAEIDKQIEANNKRLQVGDDVLCRHGEGKLVEIHSDYDSEGDDTAYPCSIEVIVNGHTFISKFNRTGTGKGGARVHRLPISFSHGSRKARKGAISPELQQQVNNESQSCVIVVIIGG